MDSARSVRKFDERQRREILSLARNAIGEYLQNRSEIVPPPLDFFEPPAAAFVTLRKESELRGCIGCTEAILPLGKTIVNCAISAAFRDPRFPELRPEELPDVRLEVSVLSEFEKIRDHSAIEIGVHGILLTHRHARGLLLPQVAVEQNWDRIAFLSYTCRKAGLPPHAWRSPDTQIEIFSAEIFSEEEELSHR
jgi:AmmeMemoRadiSam system protein A